MEFEIILVWAIIVTITLGIIVTFLVKLRKTHEDDIRKMEQRITKERTDAVDSSRNTLKGTISEQISPLLPEFYSKYEPADARFLGSPIDYVIFKNMSKFQNKESDPIEVILLDIKTGKSSLTPLQKAIQKAVENQQVKFDVLKTDIDNSRND